MPTRVKLRLGLLVAVLAIALVAAFPSGASAWWESDYCGHESDSNYQGYFVLTEYYEGSTDYMNPVLFTMIHIHHYHQVMYFSAGTSPLRKVDEDYVDRACPYHP